MIKRKYAAVEDSAKHRFILNQLVELQAYEGAQELMEELDELEWGCIRARRPVVQQEAQIIPLARKSGRPS